MKKTGIALLSTALLSSAIAMSFSGTASAAEPSVSTSSNTYNVTENKGFQPISQEVVNKLDQYVQRVDGKFVLNAPDSVLKTLDQKTLDMVNTNIDKMNRIYAKTELKTENGNSFIGHYDLNQEIKNQGLESIVPKQEAYGYNDVEFFWWGFIIHASGWWTGTIVGSGVVAAGTIMGGLAGGEIGAAAGIAVCTYVANRIVNSVNWDGFVAHYNWAWGVDKFYWQ